MWYIVYREKFKSSITGGGYFVGYKNKCEDSYSPNWFEAKKYKTLGSALTRLGVTFTPGIDTIEKFILINKIDKGYYRDLKLSKILDDNIPTNLYFNSGRIEKISDNGELIGEASDEVIDYITKEI